MWKGVTPKMSNESATRQRVTNHKFAELVGCNYTMASRLRSGNRMPSAAMLAKICTAFHLDEGEALRKHQQGSDVFSQWLRDSVFNPPATDQASHAA